MKGTRSINSSILVTLTFFSLLVLDLPVVGYAGSPHTCPSEHQGQNLGGSSSFSFVFKKDCPNYSSSGAVAWKFDIYRYSDNTRLCGGGEYSVPPTPKTISCSGLPIGSYPRVKVVISYKTSTNGSWMTHTELYGNN
jgi:hypothetical protein